MFDEERGPIARLIVNDAGELEELDGRAGIEIAREHPVLVEYAMALLATDRDSVRFSWLSTSQQWFSVRIDGERDGMGRQRATLSIAVVTPPFDLTPRELDVLTLLAGGLSNQDIASRLGTSPRTVTTHVERILAKLDQSGRAGAASVAVELGLLRLPLPGGGRSLSALAVGLIDGVVSAARAPRKGPSQRTRIRPIVLGAALSLSGFADGDGVEMLNGTRLAVDEINERGGISGRPIELHVVDCAILDPDAVARAFDELVQAEVDGITSGYTAAQQIANEVVADYGCPYLNAATLETVVERVRDDRSRFSRVFQVGPTDIHYAPGFVRFLATLEESGRWTPRSRRLAVLQVTWPGMDIGLGTLEEAAASAGWEVAAVQYVSEGTTDWEAVNRGLQQDDPAAILLGDYWPEDAAAFQRAFLADPSDALVYVLYAPSVPRYLDDLREKADGVLWATVTGTYADDAARRFAARYTVRYGVPPGRSHAGIAYDRVNILATAWARAGNPRAFGKVADEIRTVVHRGVNGAYALDNPGQCGLAYPDVTLDPSVGQAHLVYQIQRGQHRILYPEPYDDGAFEPPPWLRS
ncbi:MAG: ABC transporter substrate-binding protein [Gaiellales bacterium]